MPIVSGTGVFNTGRDCTVVLVNPQGVQVQIPNVTGFMSKQEVSTIKILRLDGVKMNASTPEGWTGSFEAERGSADIDQLFAQIEFAWYNGGSYGISQIYQYVTEASGAQSLFTYSNVALTLSDAGSWKGDASVKQTISFTADRRTMQ